MAIGPVRLPAGQVAVWVLDLADPRWDVDAAATALATAERNRAARGTPPVQRPVVGGARRRLQVSCSASGRAALVAVGDRTRLGVDVQQIGEEDVASAVAEGWLSAAELVAVQRLPPGEHARALTRAWTQKEAVLKSRGVGLRADPGQVVTPLTDRGRIGPWSLAPIEVGDGQVASLAVAAGRLRRPAVPPVVHRMVP